MLRHSFFLLIGIIFSAPPASAQAVGTGLAATTVLAVFIAVVVALIGLGIAILLWLRGRRWRVRIADERATIDGLMGAAEDLLATAEDGYMIWPYGGERAAASDRLGGMFRLDPVNIADIDALAPLIEPENFAVFQRSVAALRSNGVHFVHELQRLGDGAGIRTRGGLAGSGAAVVWFRDMTEVQNLTSSYTDQLSQARITSKNLRDLLDGAPFPVWRRNAELAVDWGNQAYCDAVEEDLATVIEKAIELVPGLGSGEARALARSALTGGQARAERRRFVVAGDRRTYELVETPLVREGAGGIAGYARDVTDRDDAAGDLERHLAAQNEVLDQVQSAIAIFGLNKLLLFFNAAYARLWRLDEDWLRTQPSHGDILERLREMRRLPEQADFPAFKAETLKLYTSVIERQEEQLHLPDGTTLRVVITPHPYGGLLFIFEDVSDRLELERDRNTLVAVQRATLDHLFEGVAVFAANGRLELYNKGYAQIWQLDLEFLDREPHVAEIAEASRKLFQDVEDDAKWVSFKEVIIRRTLDRTAGVTMIERSDGSVLRHAAVPLPDGAMLHTYLDVSDSARIERELRQRADAMEKAAQEN